MLVSKDGATFVLEEADEFDREVAELGGSVKFMRFLSRRSREKAATSIEEFATTLISETHDTGLQPSTLRAKGSSGSRRRPRSRRLKP